MICDTETFYKIYYNQYILRTLFIIKINTFIGKYIHFPYWELHFWKRKNVSRDPQKKHKVRGFFVVAFEFPIVFHYHMLKKNWQRPETAFCLCLYARSSKCVNTLFISLRGYNPDGLFIYFGYLSYLPIWKRACVKILDVCEI